MQQIVAQLHAAPGLAEEIPGREGEIVRAALNGQDVYQLAQSHQMSEGAVWAILHNAARAASGHELHEVETGSFGSDTDPGVTGGYGATGFGDIGNDGDGDPSPDEPRDGDPRSLP